MSWKIFILYDITKLCKILINVFLQKKKTLILFSVAQNFDLFIGSFMIYSIIGHSIFWEIESFFSENGQQLFQAVSDHQKCPTGHLLFLVKLYQKCSTFDKSIKPLTNVELMKLDQVERVLERIVIEVISLNLILQALYS